jgi:glycerol-3-phosphate dehydrogenase
MRPDLSSLDGQLFDALVIGGGVNGASAAQRLAAAGYLVLLVDKNDFATGASGRSSRLLHCGLRYLAPGKSAWEFARHPSRFANACRMAKAAMRSRAQFVRDTPNRVRPMKFCFPLYQDGPYATWQIDAAFGLLRALGGGDVPLNYRRVSPSEVEGTPLLTHLRDKSSLTSVAMFDEFQFDWPERVAVDAIIDAERLGACVRNYTEARGLVRQGDLWQIRLADTLDPEAHPATVSARSVFNMSGFWIDRVNARVADAAIRRRVTGTKGSHIVVRLPPECADYGIATLNSRGEPFYCVPWRGLHYFGPTETLYEGDPDDVHPTEEEFDFILGEANRLLPTLGLSRSDVLYGWSGVRPLTYDPAQPMGARSRELHDFASEGAPNMFAMTAGPIMTHRSAGEIALRAIKDKLTPTRPAARPIFTSTSVPGTNDKSTPEQHRAWMKHAVEAEHAVTIEDVMFRRAGLAWSEDPIGDNVDLAARAVARAHGWSDARMADEIRRYRERMARRLHITRS